MLKASKLIVDLQKIISEYGDVDIAIDTEAGKFPCHIVNADLSSFQ